MNNKPTYKELERKVQLNEFRLNALIELSGMVSSTKKELYDFVLEKAVQLSESTIGFLGFVNDDQKNVAIYSWSKSAMSQCEIQDKPMAFDVESSGVWAEPIRKRKPIIINDYQSPSPIKKGLPKGHIKVWNYASIPYFDKDKIVAILAVGNKKGDYNDSDINQLELFMDGMWKIVKERNYESDLLTAQEENQTQHQKVEHLYLAAKTVLDTDDFMATAKKLFESCKQLTGATSGYVALLNDKGEENEVLFLDSGGLACSVDENLPMPIHGLRAIAYKKTEAVYHNDFMKSEHIKFMPQGHVLLKNVLFAPLVINKKAVGLIGLANKPTDFTDSDLETVSAFGELASIALNNSRSHDDLVKAKENAEKNETKLKAAIHSMSDAIFISDIDGTFIDFNNAFVTFHKFKNKTDCAKTLQEYPLFLNVCMDTGEPAPMEMWAVPRALRGESAVNAIYTLERKDTGEKWVGSYNFAPIRDAEGKIIGAITTARDITNQIKTETELIKAKENAEEIGKKLSESLTDLKLAQKIASIGNWQFNPEIGTPHWSDEIYNIYERDKKLGPPHIDDYKKIYDPGQFDIFMNAFSLAINKGIGYDIILALVTSNNNKKWVRTICRPDTSIKTDKGYFLRGTIQDITKQKKLELALLQAKEKAEENEQEQLEQKKEIALSNNRLESLLKISQFQTNSIQELLDFALDEAIDLTFSKIGYIYFYNESTKQFSLNTWSKDVMKECAVMNPQTIYNLSDTGCWGEAVRQRKPIVINDYQAENPVKKGTPQGHVKLSKFLTIPIIVDNIIVAVIGVANKATDYDDSDIRQLALLMDNVWKISERITLIDDLKISKTKAEESDHLKTAFLQNMSHEIRTPLNAISGFAGMLNKPSISEEKKKRFVSIIQNSSYQLTSIVADILTISSLETNQMKVKIDKTCLNEIIVELLAIFNPQSTNQNILLYAKRSLSGKQSEIYTDKAKITQILSNLLSNSLKYTVQGSIEFGYTLKTDNEAEVADRALASQIEFYVKDTGIGIKPENQEKIFDRFRQADEDTNRLYGGTGLGLAICKGFAELLGGQIWVESEPGNGAVFYFTIPYNPVHKADTESTALEQNKKRKTILVAEDEESNFLFIEELLIDMNLNLIHAKDGKEAVAICEENPEIDLVLMDIKMPVMNGHEAAVLIKNIRPKLTIIAQSAYALESEVNEYSDVFDAYLTKPITEQLLIDEVKKAIDY